MKRLLSFMLVLLMLFALCACTDDTQTASKGIMADNQQDSTAQSVDFPVPSKMNYEDSTNKLGAKYIFTLEEFNTMLNDASKELSEGSDADFFDFNNWQLMSDNLTDDNGVMYETYCYVTDMLTITAAVEKECQKVMQISCGAPYEQFQNGTEDFQYNVILTTAILAMVAGGYESSDLEFLYEIFYNSAKEKKGFYYHSNLYMVDYSKGDENSVSVVLFMTSPCSEDIKTSWGLTDYKEYSKQATK